MPFSTSITRSSGARGSTIAEIFAEQGRAVLPRARANGSRRSWRARRDWCGARRRLGDRLETVALLRPPARRSSTSEVDARDGARADGPHRSHEPAAAGSAEIRWPSSSASLLERRGVVRVAPTTSSTRNALTASTSCERIVAALAPRSGAGIGPGPTLSVDAHTALERSSKCLAVSECRRAHGVIGSVAARRARPNQVWDESR